MTQPHPKFSVGEEVILQSVYRPELNGEYVVLDMEYSMGRNVYTDIRSIGWRYDIGIDIPPKWWVESSLRKKHKPADESFSEMMSNLDKIKEVL